MGALEAGIDGLAAAARGLGTLPELGPDEAVEAWAARVRGALPPLPFVSGNVSLYNEDSKGAAVPPSPIVACFGRLPDISVHSTPGLKQAASVLLLVGPRRGSLGGSVRAERHGIEGRALPAFEPMRERAEIALVVAAHARGLVRAAHDVSEGGLVQALAEMSFASGGELGFAADVAAWCDGNASPGRAVEAWFSEEPGFVLEVAAADVDTIAGWAAALGAPIARLGAVVAEPQWTLRTPHVPDVVLERAPLFAAWSGALAEAFTVSEEVIA
jgi:phosphoribosylformylglycinamidine synthase